MKRGSARSPVPAILRGAPLSDASDAPNVSRPSQAAKNASASSASASLFLMTRTSFECLRG